MPNHCEVFPVRGRRCMLSPCICDSQILVQKVEKLHSTYILKKKILNETKVFFIHRPCDINLWSLSAKSHLSILIFTLGSWKDFDVGILLVGSKDMIWKTSFGITSSYKDRVNGSHLQMNGVAPKVWPCNYWQSSGVQLIWQKQFLFTERFVAMPLILKVV